MAQTPFQVTSDEESLQDDQDSASSSDDDKTPDTNTQILHGYKTAPIARLHVVTQARGRKNGIIHTTLLFKYLTKQQHTRSPETTIAPIPLFSLI